jgi:hypothetical protein
MAPLHIVVDILKGIVVRTSHYDGVNAGLRVLTGESESGSSAGGVNSAR